MDPNRCQQCEHRDGGKCVHSKSLARKLPILCIVAEDDFQPKPCPLHLCVEFVEPCGILGCPDCELTRQYRAVLADEASPVTELARCAEADERIIAAAVGLVDEWRANERNPSHELAQELIAAVDARRDAKARVEARTS